MLFFRRPKVDGRIGYHGLSKWWIKSFSSREREIIVSMYNPLGGTPGSLINGKISSSSESSLAFLSSLSTWFRSPEHYAIAVRILNKGREVIKAERSVLDKHFFYQNEMEVHYRNRDHDRHALRMAIRACEDQIALSKAAAKAFRKDKAFGFLPAHAGYKQLAIIYEKNGQLQEAITLCKKAKKQGWNGDWDDRIERLRRKGAK